MLSPSLTSAIANSSSPLQLLNSSSPANLHYAFLVHSQKTLTQNLPPRVDNKLLARQKRRRTSPEDHAILEAEYLRNPKPDKIARASIVSRVSLGEKEVQIWFQNRRQNDRRKSKPLEPHELVGPRASGSSSDDLADSYHASSPHSSERRSLPTPDEASISRESKVACGQLNDEKNPELLADSSPGDMSLNSSSILPRSAKVSETIESSTDLAGLGIQILGKKRRHSHDEAAPSNEARESLQKDFQSPPSLRISLSQDGEALLRNQGEPTPSPPKAHTEVRISLSSDGEALIRTQDEPSPSKNRLRLVPSRVPRQTNLRRTVSAINFGSPAASPLLKREASLTKQFGRSRDSRMWGSYCDNDARSALSIPTNPQPLGSDKTPGLQRSKSLRSFGGRPISRPNLSSPLVDSISQQDLARTSREKRRKISRTLSSLGRLESVQQASYVMDKSGDGPDPKPKAQKGQADLETGDSDKENWVPGTYRRANTHRHQRAKSQVQRPVLQVNGTRKNTVVDDLALAKHERINRGLRGAKNAGPLSNDAGKLDDEVAAFMTKTNSSSREEDLDCIQGLLSLSQGAWQ